MSHSFLHKHVRVNRWTNAAGLRPQASLKAHKITLTWRLKTTHHPIFCLICPSQEALTEFITYSRTSSHKKRPCLAQRPLSLRDIQNKTQVPHCFRECLYQICTFISNVIFISKNICMLFPGHGLSMCYTRRSRLRVELGECGLATELHCSGRNSRLGS